MTDRRKVRVAELPEMRVAYFDVTMPLSEVPEDDMAPEFGELWDRFNHWREQVRPALGRIDIAAIGWQAEETEGMVTYRVGVPIRGDYAPPKPAKTTLFRGGGFVYSYADDVDEVPAAFHRVLEHLQEERLMPASGPIEVYKFHYNLEQHPADCGVLVEGLIERRSGGHDRPLPIG